MAQKKGKFQTGQIKSSSQAVQNRQEKVWKQVEAQREAARRKQTGKRVAIAIVSLLVVAAVALAGYLVAQRGGNEEQGSGGAVLSGQLPEKIASLSGQEAVDAAQGILIGQKGAYKATPGVPTIEMWFSYGCPACLNLEHQLGDKILAFAKEGKANLVLHPVATHALPWTIVAGNASMQVAAGQPEKALAFHQALIDSGYGVMFAKGQEAGWKDQGNSTIMTDPSKSLEKIKQVAKGIGVKDEIIKSFKPDPQSVLLEKWQKQWADAAGKQTQQIGTPMFASNGKLVENPINQDGTFNEDVLLGK
ncbi:DsbA family protein [Varibaculum vaginae]|uniref:DsbA family protein n=1 Tax=Varibaculum vaginae TaxID=2364797 RepID=UPI000F088302|nr:DsbA family protein [Varibaculum vaginae]